MIEAWYPHPNPPVVAAPKVYQSSYTPPSRELEANGKPHAYNKYQAAKKQLKPEEFVRRDKLVMDAASECKLTVGDIVVAYNDNSKYGNTRFRVCHIDRSYADFGPDNDPWEDKFARFIVGARPIPDGTAPLGNLVLASPTFFKKAE